MANERNSSGNLGHLQFSSNQQAANNSSYFDTKRSERFNIMGNELLKNRSNNTSRRNTSSVVTKNDIIIANQISNESLLSKTDILES